MEKLLLHEYPDKIECIQNLTKETRRTVQQLIDRIDAIVAGSINSMREFNDLRYF